MPLRPRHGYAADLHRDLRTGDINRPASSPPLRRVRVVAQPTSARLELVFFS